MVKLCIHEVCANCKLPCKQENTFWSGCMPPTEYCEKFKRKKGGWRIKPVYLEVEQI